MNTAKKFLMGVAALGALALGGATIAGATGGGGGAEKADGPDMTLTGTAANRAGDAAVAAVGGGTVRSVEQTDEKSPAVYEVKVDNAGKVTEVQVSKSYDVVGQQADDEEGDAADDKGDGDGETNDDAHGHQDKGDGETNDD